MLDPSQYSDTEILQAAGLAGNGADPVDSAILGQESGNNPNAPTSIDGAVGQSQIIPATFARFALPGEDIHNPADNIAVGQRYRDYLKARFNNDPARIATAYFSGEGNVAPPGSPTPWIKDKQDGNGKAVSGYVSDVLGRIGNAIVPSASAEDAPQSNQPPSQVSGVSPSDQSGNSGQPSAVPAGNGTQSPSIDQYSDAEILQAAGLSPAASQRPTASAQPPTSQSVASDIGKSAASGLAKDASYLINPLGIVKDAGNAVLGGATRLAGTVYEKAGGELSPGAAEWLTYPFGNPDKDVMSVIQKKILPAVIQQETGMNMDYQPQTGIGRAAQAAAAAAPMIASNGGSALQMFLSSLGTGTGSELGRTAAEDLGYGERGQQVGGILGGSLGALAGASSAKPASALYNWLNDNDIGAGGGGGGATDTAGKASVRSILSDTSSEPPPPPEAAPDSIKTTDAGQPLPVSARAQGEGAADLTKFLDTDGIDLNKVANDLETAQKIDPNARAIDVMAQDQGGIPGAPNVLGLAKSIAQSPGLGRSLAAEMVNRGYTATQDIGNSFDKSLSGSDFYNIKNDAVQSKEGTGPLYDAAYSHPGNQNIQSPVINRILKTNAGTSALRYAANRMNADMSQMVKPDPALAEQAQLAGQAIKGGVGKGLKLQTYQYIKEGFDEQISKAYNSGEKGLASSLTSQKNTLVRQLDDLDATKSAGQPGAYAQARKTYSTAARIQDAADAGRKFMSQDPETIKGLFNNENISAPEKKAFASGAGRSFQDMLDKARDGSNPVQAVWKESLRKRLEPMMTPSAYKQLSDEMALHQVKARVNTIVQGSPTFANDAFSAKPSATPVGSALRMFGNAMEPGMIIGKLGDIADKALQKQATRMTADSKAVAMRYLTTKDPQAIRYLARMQERTKP